MNLILPKKGILPMHCSANTTGEKQRYFLAFLVLERQHFQQIQSVLLSVMMSMAGAQMVSSISKVDAMLNSLTSQKKMSQQSLQQLDDEEQFLENIVLDADGVPDFTDVSKTQNTRGSYPIEFIDNRTPDSRGGHPQNVIFLTCDAFGVLPPISRLTPEQAAYHFISGYTAKVAGTEIGVKEPQATFSACFGEPFMPMHPGVYADLLSEKMEQNGSTAWLINTGWNGGPYGVGNRMKIKYTRAMLNAALDGDLDSVEYITDGRFGFEVPTSCPDVPSDVLQPRTTWEDKDAYDATADKLAEMFNTNFERYAAGVSDSVNEAAPQTV